MSKDKKPQAQQDEARKVPLRESESPNRGGRAYDDIDNRVSEATQRPTPPPKEENE